MKVSIVNVLRNTFKDNKGREVKYCKFGVLVELKKDENQVGYTIEQYTTKYENYDLIAKVVEEGKPIELKCEFKKALNGLYKAVPVKLGEIDL